MASCPKCGKGRIKKRNGKRKCKRCGILTERIGKMSEDGKVTNIQNPSDNNSKLKQDFEKEWQPKLAEVRKKTIAAIRSAINERKALSNLLEDYEEDKEAFNAALNG